MKKQYRIKEILDIVDKCDRTSIDWITKENGYLRQHSTRIKNKEIEKVVAFVLESVGFEKVDEFEIPTIIDEKAVEKD